ncbi:uncharacterized protein [Miscanthus floridulus]|uniref:uncharacterized protein isoform X5 n=1 Tax=Miscanthus floridulus TaxID=154761 RepID=UPI003457AD9A
MSMPLFFNFEVKLLQPVLENTMIYAPLSSFMSNGCLDLLARFGFSDHLKKGEEFSQFLRFPEDSSLMSSAGTIVLPWCTSPFSEGFGA